jgi:hypothetical protein
MESELEMKRPPPHVDGVRVGGRRLEVSQQTRCNTMSMGGLV